MSKLFLILAVLYLALPVKTAPTEVNDTFDNEQIPSINMKRLITNVEGKFRRLKDLDNLVQNLGTKYNENTEFVRDAIQNETIQRKEVDLTLIAQQKFLVENAMQNTSKQIKQSELNLKTEMKSNSEKHQLFVEERINLLRQEFQNKFNLMTNDKANVTDLTLSNDKIKKITQDVEGLKSMDKAVPKGFIYLQLPFQKSPSEIWVGTQWDDISSKYAGKFLRVAGGNAAAFESSQPETFPRLTGAQSYLVKANSINDETKYVYINPGTTSGQLWTGDDRPGIDHLIKTSFTMSGGEVRPANYAIKVWQRK